MVVGDGTAHGSGTPPQPGGSLEDALADDAEVIAALAQVPTVAFPVPAWDAAPRFAAKIQQLPAQVAAVFLTHTDPTRARSVQRLVEQASGPPVLTDEDATAIALTASALVYLRRLERDPHRSRILIAAAIRMPILSALLLVTGIPDITLWNSSDATWFPLHRAARDADVVIDLSRDIAPGDRPAKQPGARPRKDPSAIELELDRPEGSVITPHGLDGRALIVPGLFRALAEQPTARPLGLDIYGICARALAQATPPRRELHGQSGRGPDAAHDITADITDTVALALHVALTQPRDRGQPPAPTL